MQVEGAFCFCLEPFFHRDWLKDEALLDWIAAHPVEWRGLPDRLTRPMFNHSAKPENPVTASHNKPMHSAVQVLPR